MRKAYKSIISLAVVLIAGLNFIVPALAQDPFTAIAIGGATGFPAGGLFSSMAAMSGIDLTYNSTDPLDAIWNPLNPDHVFFSGEKHEATNVGEDVYDYIEVDLQGWLAAQQEFISGLKTDNNITDNSSGSIGTSYKMLLNVIPLYYNGTRYQSKYYPTNYTWSSNVWIEGYPQGSSQYVAIFHYNNTNVTLICDSQAVNQVYFFQSGSSTPEIRVTDGTHYYGRTITSSSTTPKTDTVNYTSGNINLDVFNGWESAKVKISSSISQLQSGWTISDFLSEIDRIWYGAGEDQIIIEDGGDTPVPPVPIPDTPLGDVPFDDWVDLWGQGIYQQLENQSDALDLIGSNGIDAIEELESIDTNTQDIEEAVESVDTNIGIGNGILGGIRSLAQSAVDFLDGIAEHVGELVEEIVEGTETLIAGILNQIPQAFGVIFGPIKQASSIWHYVVEWLQSIGAPFQFIWSMASGTSYYIILPVYASLAAAVVLAFYKRFGK